MADGQSLQSSNQQDLNPENATTIQDIELAGFELLPALRFLFAFGLGVFFFLVPVTWNGQITVPFDVAASTITARFPSLVGAVGIAILALGAGMSIMAEFYRRGMLSMNEETITRLNLQYWKTSPLFLTLRISGLLVGSILFLNLGPSVIHKPNIGGLVWGTIVLSIVVIIPLGAVFVNLLVELGGLEFVGTLARPFMRPLFNLPGRAALDSLASWIGAFTVGYYVTYNVFHRGGYHKRDVFIITTCFAPVSIGFVGVIVSTLGLLDIFPLILLSWIIATVVTGAILVRIPPLNSISTEYITEPDPETVFTGSPLEYVRFAFSQAMDEAEDGKIITTAIQGLIDGVKVIAVILGTVVTISTVTLLLIDQTNVFQLISAPITPVLSALGVPNPSLAASAILISGVEQISAAAVVAGSDTLTRFFVVVVSISQIIFFAASAPMMVDMFKEIPIRFRDLVVIFCLRTAVLVPIAAVLMHGFNMLGLLS
ncbi:YjiH family protein [Halomicrococcus sp. NG-SE-24]|uniref:YjiH family protein n=1 Tax=Halomicrococcus sp. NG-SE-24 TaxID=3436928 RepID=UPI003D96CD2B